MIFLLSLMHELIQKAHNNAQIAMAGKLYSDIFVLLINFKRSADRLWLETPPQTFMQGR